VIVLISLSTNFYYDERRGFYVNWEDTVGVIENTKEKFNVVREDFRKEIKKIHERCFFRHIDKVAVSRIKRLLRQYVIEYIRIDRTSFLAGDIVTALDVLGSADFDVYVNNASGKAMFVSKHCIVLVVSNTTFPPNQKNTKNLEDFIW